MSEQPADHPIVPENGEVTVEGVTFGVYEETTNSWDLTHVEHENPAPYLDMAPCRSAAAGVESDSGYISCAMLTHQGTHHSDLVLVDGEESGFEWDDWIRLVEYPEDTKSNFTFCSCGWTYGTEPRTDVLGMQARAHALSSGHLMEKRASVA